MNFPIVIIVLILLFTVSSAGQAGAQSATVDTTFRAVPTNPPPSDLTFKQIVQPDGKVIVYNASSMFVNGELRSGMFRLNADGSTDTTFSYNDEGGVGINNIMLAPDGKIILAGTTSPNHAKMIRLNPNGSLDNSFSVFIAATGPPDFTGNVFTVNAVQPDGKVIGTHTSWGNIQGTWYSYSMRRYNVDGSVDSSFTSPALDGGHLVSTSALIQLLPDGRFYLAISTGNHLGRSINLTRRLADGTTDPTFGTFSRSISAGFFINFSDMTLSSDGGVIVTGLFWPSQLGGPYNRNILRFLPNGSMDPGFNPPNSNTGDGVHLLPDGKILHSASLTSGAAIKMMRFGVDGVVDNTYVMDPTITAIKNAWQTDATNRPVFLATTTSGARLVRLTENGAIDPTFTPAFGGSPGTVSVAAVQPDGKVIVSGSFSEMNGAARNRFARLNTDGSVDTTFDTGTGFNIAPRSVLILDDGRILVMGNFSAYNGATVSRIIRLNPNGSVDGTFTASVTANSVLSAAVQTDGKIVIVGTFSAVNGVARTGIARVDASGALDESFNPVIGMPSGGGVTSAVVEPSGKIAFTGLFTTVNGASRPNLARIDPTGATDPTFDGGGLPEGRRIYRQPDGKYILLNANSGIFRRNSDGSADTSFNPPTFTDPNGTAYIESVLLRPDGSMIVGGNFASVNGAPRWYVTRLGPNGAHDSSFLSTGTNSIVFWVAASGTGKVVIAGSFTTVENIGRIGIARLNVPDFQKRTAFDFDGDGRADISVLRSSSNRWYELLSSNNSVHEETFGVAGDVLAPADFDGDGITDEGIFRPSNGQWWYHSSVNGSLTLNPFGGPGDIPRPSDFDGDGKADLVLFRPSTNTWFRFSSLTNTEVAPKEFGIAGDQPLVGDFDGDGKGDLAIFRPSSGDWWYAASSANGAFRTAHWGQNGDIPVPADYDGDGKTDYAIFRPSDGGWYIYNSGNGSFTTTAFGVSTDRPVAADYDGDGRADLAVFRPSTGIWYLLRSTSGFAGYQFGISTDTAIAGSLIP